MRKILRRVEELEVEELCNKKKYQEALDLVKKYNISGVTLTKSKLKSKYGLKPKDIEKLNYIEVDNPHFSSAGNMRLYLRIEAFRYSNKLKQSVKSKSPKTC